MAGITIAATTYGLPEFMEKLAALKARRSGEVSLALLESAEDALTFSIPLCRVDTGFMVSRNNTRMVGKYTSEFYNDAPYAVYNELGTYKMSAQPWMYPGWEYGCIRLEQRLVAIAAMF